VTRIIGAGVCLVVAASFSLFLQSVHPTVVFQFMVSWSFFAAIVYATFVSLWYFEPEAAARFKTIINVLGRGGVFSAVAISYLFFVVNAYSTTGPVFGTLFAIAAGFVTFAICNVWIVQEFENIERKKKADEENKQKAQKLLDVELQRQALADEWDKADPFPIKKHFVDALRGNANPLNPELLERMLQLFGCVYDDFKIDKLKTRPAEAKAAFLQLCWASVNGLNAFAANLPAYLRTTSTDTIFTQIIHPTEEQLQAAIHELAKPFIDVKLYHHFDWTRMNPYDAHDGVLKRHYTDDTEGKRQYEKDFKEADKNNEVTQKALSPIERSVQGTPYYTHISYLRPTIIHAPFKIEGRARFAGTWVVAPPGRGKTNLLHNMISEDRKQNATIVLMDSKGDLIQFYKGYDDVVIIEPSTVQINPFQLGTSTRTLDFLEYIFSALLETKLTPKQTTLFRCVLALILRIPNATIETFRKVLVHGWKDHEPYVMTLDEDNRDFFYVEGRKSEFDGGQYQETKQEVLQRLRFLVSNDYMKKIFTAPTSNTNFFELLDSGKTIVIDNSKDELGETGAEFFGRFFIALVWMAAVSRSKLRQEQKVPVYFYIDECHTVVRRDTKITTILDECRSQKIALILAHQRIAQIEAPVLDALSNCAIRIANSDDDAEALSKRFRIEPEALRLPVGSFACFVRDQTAQACTVTVPEFDVRTFPQARQRTSSLPPLKEPFKPRLVPKNDLDFG
jgi:hypothetical protein